MRFALIENILAWYAEMQSIQQVFAVQNLYKFFFDSFHCAWINRIYLVKIVRKKKGMQCNLPVFSEQLFRFGSHIVVKPSLFRCFRSLSLTCFFSCSICHRAACRLASFRLHTEKPAKTATWMSSDDNIANRNCNKYLNKNENDDKAASTLPHSL